MPLEPGVSEFWNDGAVAHYSDDDDTRDILTGRKKTRAMRVSGVAGNATALAKFHNLKGIHEHAAKLHDVAAEFHEGKDAPQSAYHRASAEEHRRLAKLARDA